MTGEVKDQHMSNRYRDTYECIAVDNHWLIEPNIFPKGYVT